MSTAVGRLWLRAPLWRRTVLVTGVALGLTVAFPPAWLSDYAILPQRGRSSDPQIGSPRTPTNPVLSAPAGEPSSQAVATPVTGVPVAGMQYSGRLPLGAQTVPLPPGRWVALAVRNVSANPTGGPPDMSAFLALVAGGRIVAAAIITGSITPDATGTGFPPPLQLEIPSFYYRRTLSAVDHGALDLWLCGLAQPAKWNDPLSLAASGVIRQQGLFLPDRFASAVFRLADTRNWISAEFLYPDPASTSEPVIPWAEAAALSDTAALSQLEKVRRWGKQWHEIIRSGFIGTLRPGDEARIAPP